MMNLEPLMSPRSVAIVGASASSWYGHLVLDNLQACGYQGSVFPINPKYSEICGLTCFPSLLSVGQPIDCVVIALAKDRVVDVLEQAAAVGVHAAVIFASGFAELNSKEGIELQERARRVANNSIASCGPNCLGLINVHRGIALYGGPNPQLVKPGCIGAVLQSGSIAIGLACSMADRALGMSYLITAGNQMNVDISDYIDYLIDDENTRVIAGYVEGVTDAEKFVRTAERARSAGKPLVILKVGRSEKGARAAVAHTGALVGSDAVYDAVFRQKGVIRVDDFDELIETVAALSGKRSPKGRGVGVLTISGGDTGVIADVGERAGLEFPEFGEHTRRELARVLPAYVTIANPFDSTGAGVVERKMGPYAEALRLIADDVNVSVIVVSQDAREGLSAAGKHENELFRDIAGTVAQAASETRKPIVLLSPFSGKIDKEGSEILQAADVPLLCGLRPGLAAVGHLIDVGANAPETETRAPERITSGVDVDRLRAHLGGYPARVMAEHEANQILEAYGVPSARSFLAEDELAVRECMSRLGGPVALKVVSPDIPHRSKIGAVALGITDPTEAVVATRRILANAQKAAPDARVLGVLVQEMAPPGIEVIIGLSRDPQFGCILVFGMGGVLVEVLHDVSLRVLPITRRDAESMIQQVKGFPVLAGAKGHPRMDLEALTEALLRVAEMGADLGDLVDELDINPMIVMEAGNGVQAVDSLMVLRREARSAVAACQVLEDE